MKRHPAYTKGFNDGLEYCKKIIQNANEYHKGIALCIFKSIEKGKK